jgi:cell division septum initiation protein DivIVA
VVRAVSRKPDGRAPWRCIDEDSTCAATKASAVDVAGDVTADAQRQAGDAISGATAKADEIVARARTEADEILKGASDKPRARLPRRVARPTRGPAT